MHRNRVWTAKPCLRQQLEARRPYLADTENTQTVCFSSSAYSWPFSKPVGATACSNDSNNPGQQPPPRLAYSQQTCLGVLYTCVRSRVPRRRQRKPSLRPAVELTSITTSHAVVLHGWSPCWHARVRTVGPPHARPQCSTDMYGAFRVTGGPWCLEVRLRNIARVRSSAESGTAQNWRPTCGVGCGDQTKCLALQCLRSCRRSARGARV